MSVSVSLLWLGLLIIARLLPQPTSMRAIRARYNPFLQTRHRVEQLKQLGHSVDKVEFIVMGGTFMALPDDYRNYFVRNLHDALSGHTSDSVEEAVKSVIHFLFPKGFLSDAGSAQMLISAFRYSEKSKTKCIGITIETRPDYCLRKHLRWLWYL